MNPLPGVAALCVALSAVFFVSGCAAPANDAAAVTASNTTASGDHVTASDEPESHKRARVRLELASAYYSRGQLTTALDEVKLAINANPHLPEAFNLRGLIYSGLGDDKLGEESFLRALQLDARNADTMQNYGWFMCQRKRYPEADAMFVRALAVPNYRDVPRTLLTQGICQAREGKWAEAEATLLRSYQLDSANPATAVNLTEVLYRRGDYERARFYIRRVNGNANIANAQTLWLAARVENRLGNRQGVQELGNQLRDRFPQSREINAFDEGRFDE